MQNPSGLPDNPRATRLRKTLESVLFGRIQVNRQNFGLFIEAICACPSPADCVSRLISNAPGLDSLKISFTTDLSLSFLNGPATKLLRYLQAPELHTIGGGDFLRKILICIVDPPFFWDAFIQAYEAKSLQGDGCISYAWLLLQLISLDRDDAKPYRVVAQKPGMLDSLLDSSQIEVRTIGSKIKHILITSGPSTVVIDDFGPGGRHDNDFTDFRDISILPTADEIVCVESPFLRQSASLDKSDSEDDRLAAYLDNQFRLLREDMLHEMREEIHIFFGKKKRPSRNFVIDGLVLLAVHISEDTQRRNKWGIEFRCQKDLPQFAKEKPKDRKAYLNDNPKIFRHQSQTCLIVDGEVLAFPTVNRVEDLLAKRPPVIVLEIEGETVVTKTLLKLKTAEPHDVRLVQIDSAIFSFEPILNAIKDIQEFPLSPELLFWNQGSDIRRIPSSQLSSTVESIRNNLHGDLQGVIGATRPVLLDRSQADSLIAGLTQKVSLIQGPPGTGKSFIGALLAKVLHDSTRQTILIVCYTNHALDQFLEDLLDIGIPEQSIVRLGSKHSTRTEPLGLHKQGTSFRFGRPDWSIIHGLRGTAAQCGANLAAAFKSFTTSKVTYAELLEHVEFEDAVFYEAFCVPLSNDGMTTVGRGGQAVNETYLLERWATGKNAGIYIQSDVVRSAPEVWQMSIANRQAKLKSWGTEILKVLAQNISALGKEYNKCMHGLSRKYKEKDAAILMGKRIIGCTTTAAAMYRESIQAASPGIVLVEEAGEILESHVLTALSPETTQLILIGDHKQLRPKVNHYLLTVEKGEGYDLNRSLFERLVLKGYPHKTLTQQHRMRPEISALIRELTYPDLVDADSTKGRPALRGIQNNIVFINHEHPEDELQEVADRRDVASSSSKQNTYEVEMVLKIVRYLGQQGYGTEKLVILTPYLGQLHKLRDALKKDNDPVLNDLDSYDLVRAGLLPAASANVNKKSLRLATIDNYQGEESDIVIGSLTRSNSNCDIGFMSSPERVNVLLSRARNGLILLGNSATFLGARKGKELWDKVFTLLKTGRHIYDGLPVKCERHPGRNAILSQAIDFDTECPDGGCKEPCTVTLNCDVHTCPSKCHQLYDHSRMPCQHVLDMKCPKGHTQSWRCHESPPSTCPKCERAAKLAERQKAKAADLQRKRDADELAHAQKLADVDEKIAAEAQAHRDRQLAEDRTRALQQKQKDLETAMSRTSQASTTPSIISDGHPSPSVQSASKSGLDNALPASARKRIVLDSSKAPSACTTIPTQPEVFSSAQMDWERRKKVEGASNDSIDGIMELIGLEDVKKQVLRIYAKIELAKRQGTSLRDERLNIVLLGNPGTGKTTVARHYAKFLSSIEVLPGSEFIETTGSRLANEGVAGIKKHIETLVNAGGGALFVDETYQLTGAHNFQGSQVLDFMLAEMENHVGTIVFIFAGYDREMEKFFEHNPGLTSRVPYKLHFADYSDEELLSMLEQLIHKKYGGRMKVEDGIRGLYGRIAIRRLGRGRGREGFGNARALRNLFAKVGERQAERLHKERSKGLIADDFVLHKQDLIGPDPSEAMVESTAWKKLQSLIGLAAVKESIRNFFDLIATNYGRELAEKEPVQVSLNRVFLGSPGTGKTTVAKLYGQILSDLGLLSGSEVVTKNPADFIGSAMGESEKNTKDILANTVGKVLIIDEAYMLYGGSGIGNQNDPYKTAVIDTIVAEVQSVPGEDRCVLLLGYKDQMENMFQNVNSGLSRRFAIENAFQFDDFSDTELLEVLNKKLKDQDLGATDKAKTVAIEVLSRSRNRPNFGNAGEVENLLGQAKARYQTRQALLPIGQRNFDVIFDCQDFDPDFDRNKHASNNLQKLFEDVVGCEDTVRVLGEYQQVARVLKAKNIDPRGEVPMNFVFKGPPGTGKTTTARKMGQVYFDMGLLSSCEVVECSASDLVGQYVGQTGPKTQNLLEKALGRVLFIDEAYRLSEGHSSFAKEAIDELVGAMTQDKFKSKIVIILAGYDQEMNELMAVNTGLSSRFPDEIIFRDMEPEHCLEVLKRELKKKNISLKMLDNPASPEYKEMSVYLHDLTCLPSWANARDITALSKKMVNIVYKKLEPSDKSDEFLLSAKDALACMKDMLIERRARTQNLPTKKLTDIFGGMQQMPNAPTFNAPATSAKMEAKQAIVKRTQDMELESPHEVHSEGRDAGVTDEIWRQLKLDKEAYEFAARQSEENMRRLESELEEATKREKAQQVFMRKVKLDEARTQDELERDRLRRLHEEMRIREAEERMKREKAAALLQQEREKERQEAKVQRKLRSMGVCVAGFQWIKQPTGYRCAGGVHFVDNAALEI